jgi:NAD(P)-dependent dehydrogenase (short-subunit alcohol dehydrogenase family)
MAAAKGAELFLTDIDQGRLDAAAEQIRGQGGTVRYARAADISDYDAVRSMAAEIHADAGPMDLVMNIAGISAWGTVRTLDHRHWRSMVEVNLMGPIHVIETFLPPMIEAGGGGYLVNVSSAAGLVGLPWHAAYSASKFGLRGVSEVLRFDLRRHGIGVSLVCPGAVDTPLTETVEIAGVDTGGAAFRRLRAGFRKSAASPEQAAAAILKGVRRNRYLVHTSTGVRLLYLLQRTFPPLYVLIMRLMNSVLHRVLDDQRVRAGAPGGPVRGERREENRGERP